MKQQRGITLVALVVTIIILLILAGVGLTLTVGQDGIIKKSKEAVDKYNKVSLNEEMSLQETGNILDSYLKGENSSDGPIDLKDYATVDFQAFVGKYVRQSSDYLKIYVEIANSQNPQEKIIFNIGTDWKQHVERNDPNHLFTTDENSDLKMIQVLENDARYKADNTTMGRSMLNAFTDVKITWKLKKGVDYTIKVVGQGANVKNSVISTTSVEIYKGTTGNVSGDTTIHIAKDDSNNHYKSMFDLNGDGYVNSTDGAYINRVILGIDGNLKGYKIQDTDLSTAPSAAQLLNENGQIVNPDYIGFDFNRDGYIGAEDVKIPDLIALSSY